MDSRENDKQLNRVKTGNIESAIRENRDQMDHTLNAIGEKLNPVRLISSIKDQTKEKVHQMGSAISSVSKSTGHKVKEGYDKSLEETKDFVAAHPLLIAAGALGAGVIMGYLLNQKKDSIGGMRLAQKGEGLFNKGKDLVRSGVEKINEMASEAKDEAHSDSEMGFERNGSASFSAKEDASAGLDKSVDSPAKGWDVAPQASRQTN